MQLKALLIGEKRPKSSGGRSLEWIEVFVSELAGEELLWSTVRISLKTLHGDE